MKKEWVEKVKNVCDKANIPFMFKQWGGKNKAKTGRKLNGIEYSEMPFNTI